MCCHACSVAENYNRNAAQVSKNFSHLHHVQFTQQNMTRRSEIFKTFSDFKYLYDIKILSDL